MRTSVFRMLWICAWTALAGCGSGDPLDYDTAMSVLREHGTEPIKTTFNSSPRFDANEPRIKSAYQDLIDSHVIECSESAGLGMICTPGPAGDTVKQDGTTELSLEAGQWIPAAIVSIQRSGRNAATAEVRMSFEPSALYREFEAAFSDIQDPAATQALSSAKQPKMMRAVFQRYQDEWHVESLE